MKDKPNKCIERSIENHKQENVDSLLAIARKIRSQIKAPLLTDAELSEMKNAGRR